MSYTDPNLYPEINTDAPPAHHLHKASDPIPRAAGGGGAGGTEDARDPQSYEDRVAAPDAPSPDQPTTASHTGRSAGAGMGMGMEQETGTTQGRGARAEERPLGVRPTERGGVAMGGRADVPETHASAADKLVGKTQKVVGKMTGKPEMHERGELRETGGKAAARGEGRALHD